MAYCLPFPPVSLCHHHQSSLQSPIIFQRPPICFLSAFNCSSNQTFSSAYEIQRSSRLPRRASSLWRSRCGATSPRPPSPPESGQPPGEDPSSSSPGLVATVYRFQESVRIFFAVLFWMSLFFWSSVWDGRNRSDKGPRFRK